MMISLWYIIILKKDNKLTNNAYSLQQTNLDISVINRITEIFSLVNYNYYFIMPLINISPENIPGYKNEKL